MGPGCRRCSSGGAGCGSGDCGREMDGLAELRVTTYGRGIWEIPLLTSGSATAAAMTLNPTGLTFAAEAIAGSSALRDNYRY